MASTQCMQMIGIGLAGAQATWQLTETGLKLRLTEMRGGPGQGPLKAIGVHTVHSGTCSFACIGGDLPIHRIPMPSVIVLLF